MVYKNFIVLSFSETVSVFEVLKDVSDLRQIMYISIICFVLVLLKYIYTKNFEIFQPKKPQTFQEPHDYKIPKSPGPPSNLTIIIY